MKKNLTIVITNRASYGRLKPILFELKKINKINLQIIVGGSLLLYQFGNAAEIIEEDGFKIHKKLNFNIAGYDLHSQSKSTGLAVIEITNSLKELESDLVMTFADRFETLATAIASSYMNIGLIHLQGGEVSGNIDDKVRNAITQLADYHFPATKLSKNRLIKMGIEKKNIFMYGCPSIDLIKSIDTNNNLNKKYGGTGNDINWSEDYILVLQHPVTTSYGEGYSQMKNLLRSIKNLKLQKIVLWPNIDAGSNDLSKAIREFRENLKNHNFHFFRNFSPEDFLKILKNCKCAVGNSSSFLREGSYFGTPVVLIGDRQKNRERSNNVIEIPNNSKNIVKVIISQINHGKYKSSKIYGNGNASKKIALRISKIKLNKTKVL